MLRKSSFPVIEKRYGEEMEYWFKLLTNLDTFEYKVLSAYLMENFGFSAAHANTVVMYFKGSTSTQKYASFPEYYQSIDPLQVKTLKLIFSSILSKFPNLEKVIAWNQPMLKFKGEYILGVSVANNFITIAPWNVGVLDKYRPLLKDYKVTKKTFSVPNDWMVDKELLQGMVLDSVALLK